MVAAVISLLAATSSSYTMYVNAKIWTDGHLTKDLMLFVRDDKVAFVGDPSFVSYRPSNLKIVDVHGAVIIPGLIDSHAHMIEGGIGLNSQVDLRGAKNKEEFIRLVREFAKTVPAGKWIVGHGWSAESWPGRPQPTKEWIDEATAGHPAILSRMDGHSALVNSEALRQSHINADGPANPKGGVIDRDPSTQEPTGILRDSALQFVRTPDPTDQVVYHGFLTAVREANKEGITAVSDIEAPNTAELYRHYFAGNPTIRVGFYSNYALWDDVYRTLAAAPKPSAWFRANGIKAYMDGSLGSRTAYMHAPFTTPLANQSKDWRGAPRAGATSGLYAKKFPQATARGYQLIVHAIGDQANHDVLDLFAAIPNHESKRFRVEHAQHLLPEDIARFGELGVIASMQPYHKADDGRYAEDIIGVERCRSSYAYRSILKSGGRLAFGSDWPVVSNNPWLGIATAVTGKIMTGKVWMPQENITLDQALDAYTRSGAYAIFMEDKIGSLKPGYQADFVILDRDPFKKGTDLASVKAKSVYVAGKLVYHMK